MTRRFSLVCRVALAAMLAVSIMPVGAAKKSIEQYQANAVVMGSPVPGRAAILNINIYRWSTDSERDDIVDAAKEASESKRAYRAVPNALRNQKKAGYMFLSGQQGYPIRYTRQIESGGQRQIVLATDRPMTFAEVYAGSQVRDFDITLIVLNLDDSGRGEGIASVGTEIVWDEAAGKLQVTNTSSEPVRLTDVRKVQ